MISLLIGLSWTGTTALATFAIIGAIIFGEGPNTFEQTITNIACIIFLIPFWIIGISLIIVGIKGIKKMKGYIEDYKTNPTLYGKIYNACLTNQYGECRAKFDIEIYNHVERMIINTTVYLSERDINRFKAGVYVQMRKVGENYLIEKRLVEDEVPMEARVELRDVVPEYENGNKTHKDTVVVNGVEYVRKK